MADEKERRKDDQQGIEPTSEPSSKPKGVPSSKASPEEKFRLRLAAEAYDTNNSIMTKYKEYNSTDTEEDDDDRHHNKHGGRSKASICRCDQIAAPLLIILSICLLVVVGFVLITVLFKIQLDKANRICQSPDCVTTSGVMLSKMDLSVDPCHDFYQYACTAFTKDVMIPPDRVVWSTFNVMMQRNMAVMRQLLESDGSEYRGSNSSAIQKTKRFYSACMNVTTPEIQGNAPMLKLIKLLGSWALTSDSMSGPWSPSDWNFETTLSMAHSYGVSPFFNLDVSADDKNSSVNIIQIDQAGLSLSDYQSYFGNESDMFHDAYVQYFKEIVQLLGGNQTNAEKLVDNVWQLEKALAKAFLKPSERADVQQLYNLMTVSDIQKLFGQTFDFSEYLRLSFGTLIPMTEKVIVRVPQYFRRLGILLKHLSNETRADYIVWLMVQKLVPYMSTPYNLAQLKLRSTVYKVSSFPPRWESCVYRATDAMGFAAGALYIKNYFSEQDKENVESLYKRIVDTFRSRIPHATWMDKKTQLSALDKVSGLIHKIGYPDFLLEPAKLDDYYEKLSVGDSAFQNILIAEKFTTDRVKHRIEAVPDRAEWLMTPAEVNAYYDPSRNQIVLPAGILQQPFTHRSFPKSLSFGALGFIIGHELTHGFDNSGRQFDKYGNMVDWWGNGSVQEFTRRSQCLVDEYNGFQVYGEQIDGLSTLGENIADNGGIKISLEAYEEWMKSNSGEDELLPGLNMTSLQQFFLSYAQVWCTFYTRQYAIQAIVTDSHSNAKYRVNGVLQNTPKFSEAFNCPSDSAMNPQQKCSLW